MSSSSSRPSWSLLTSHSPFPHSPPPAPPYNSSFTSGFPPPCNFSSLSRPCSSQSSTVLHLAHTHWPAPIFTHPDYNAWVDGQAELGKEQEENQHGGHQDSDEPKDRLKNDSTMIEYSRSMVEDVYVNVLIKGGHQEVMLLELSHFFEHYLWPHFPHDSVITDNQTEETLGYVSVYHIMCMVKMLNEKIREGVPLWGCLKLDTSLFYKAKFRRFFYTLLHLTLPLLPHLPSPPLQTPTTLTCADRVECVRLLIHLFQSFEQPVVRELCLHVCGPLCWNHVGPAFANQFLFARNKQAKLLWKQANARRTKALKHLHENIKQEDNELAMTDKLSNYKYRTTLLSILEHHINLNYFHSLTLHLLSSINSISSLSAIIPPELVLCERYVEWLVDLLSQLWCRRFLHPLLLWRQVVARARRSELASHDEGALFNQLFHMLGFYQDFEIDDSTGEPVSGDEAITRHTDRVWQFQKECYSLWNKRKSIQNEVITKDQERGDPVDEEEEPSMQALKECYWSNVASLSKPHTLRAILRRMGTTTLTLLSGVLLRMELKDVQETSRLTGRKEDDEELLVEAMASILEEKEDALAQINSKPLYPTEEVLWDPNLVPSEHYRGESSLALPKLNLQFLTIYDYLVKNFSLFWLESTHDIRCDIQDAIMRMVPARDENGRTRFDGSWSWSTPLESLTITNLEKPRLGEKVPRAIHAELQINLGAVRNEVKEEWDQLRQFDVLFLVSVLPPTGPLPYTKEELQDAYTLAEFPERFGVAAVRGAEVSAVLDEEGKVISEINANPAVGNLRTIHVLLDPAQYATDIGKQHEEEEDEEDVGRGIDLYGTFNLVVRREPRANNFKAVLQTIRGIMNNPEDTVVPEWLHDLFLGYGDPSSAQYYNLPSQLNRIDFLDTFLNNAHLQEALAQYKAVKFRDETTGSPYVLEFHPEEKTSKGKRALEVVEVSTYTRQPSSSFSTRRINTVRFSPAQVDAIRSGVNPGLTVIVGPPGTGKTDTAVQIVNLLYHNFPGERTLLVAHSNQALNELFSKIVQLDISERYLLRLGLGEKDLNTGKDYSKWGRVNHMLERRMELLGEVTKLCKLLQVPGNVAMSCEGARQLYEFFVLPKVQKFYGCVELVTRQSKEGHGQEDIRVVLLKCVEVTKGHPWTKPFKKETHAANKKRRKQEEMNVESDEEEEEDDGVENVEMDDEPDRKQNKTTDDILELLTFGQESVASLLFPFPQLFESSSEDLFPTSSSSYSTLSEALTSDKHCRDLCIAERCFLYVVDMFKQIEECHAFELMRTTQLRSNYLLTKHARIIAMTCTHAALTRQNLVDLNFKYDSLIMEESAQILEVETFIPMLLQQSDQGVSRLKRVVLIGDHNQLPPVVKNRAFQQYGRLDQSMFSRLVRLQVPTIELDTQGRARPLLCDLYRWCYSKLNDLPHVFPENGLEPYRFANAGLCHEYQFINVEDYAGRGEYSPLPFVYENLGEAEYAVHLFLYLRLLGYPASRISVLTTYNGQVKLLKDVIKRRCSRAIGEPILVTTVDKYQGQQNDYIILSLVRTNAVGHLRDVRRLIVAMSRAKFGLYIFGRFNLFNDCIELTPVFSLLSKRPTNLALSCKDEQWPSRRPHDDVVPKENLLYVRDVNHMFDIVQKKAAQIVEIMKKKAGVPSPES